MRFGLLIKQLIAGMMALKYIDVWLMPFKVTSAFFKTLKETSKGLRPLFKNKKVYLFASVPPINTIAFRRYLKGVKSISKGSNLPLEVHISLTDNCAYACKRCSNFQIKTEPSFSQIKNIIELLKKSGTATISFTGGEPGLREDLAEIVALCKNEISSTIYTSGQGLDKQKLMALKQSGLEKLYVSLDHYDEKTHNLIRKNQQAFQKAIDVIEKSINLNIYTVAQAVINDALLKTDQMEKYLDFVKKLGVDEVMILEDINVKRNTEQLDSEESKTKNYLIDLQIKCANNEKYPRVSTMSFLERADYVGCQAGFSFCYINSAGDVFPCDFVPLSFGNIHQNSLEQIFNRFKQTLKNPSCNCLAKDFQKNCNETSSFPSKYDETQQILKNYSPGKPPGLLI